MRIVLLAISLFLSACATKTPQVPIIQPVETVRVDPRLLEPADDLPYLKSGTEGDLVTWSLLVLSSYTRLKNQNEKLRLFNCTTFKIECPGITK